MNLGKFSNFVHQKLVEDQIYIRYSKCVLEKANKLFYHFDAMFFSCFSKGVGVVVVVMICVIVLCIYMEGANVPYLSESHKGGVLVFSAS